MKLFVSYLYLALKDPNKMVYRIHDNGFALYYDFMDTVSDQDTL